MNLYLSIYIRNDIFMCRYILETNKSDLQNMIVSIKVISATYDRECLMGNRGGVKPSPGNQHLTSKRLTINAKLREPLFALSITLKPTFNDQFTRPSMNPFNHSPIHSSIQSFILFHFQNASRPSIASSLYPSINNIFLLSITLFTRPDFGITDT